MPNPMPIIHQTARAYAPSTRATLFRHPSTRADMLPTHPTSARTGKIAMPGRDVDSRPLFAVGYRGVPAIYAMGAFRLLSTASLNWRSEWVEASHRIGPRASNWNLEPCSALQPSLQRLPIRLRLANRASFTSLPTPR